MAVGADHHSTGERIVLEHHLVNNAAAWAPKPDAVFGRHAAQKVVDLFIGVDGYAHVDARTDFGHNQVVAMHGGWHGRGGQAGGRKLQQRHLRGGVLHGHAVGVEVGVAAAAFNFLAGWVGQMVHQNFLGQRQRAPQAFAGDGYVAGQLVIHVFDEFDGGVGTHDVVVVGVGHGYHLSQCMTRSSGRRLAGLKSVPFVYAMGKSPPWVTLS